MKQLRKQIKKEIKRLMEATAKAATYPAPPEILNTLRDTLKLRPVIRYVATLKAVNSIPPSYKVFLNNGQAFDLYYEDTSIVAKIGAKSYWLADMGETAEAIKHLNRVLTQPIPKKPGEEEEEGGEAGGAAGGEAGGEEAEMEPVEDETAGEEPEA